MKMILKMASIFNIDDIVGYILSLIPRRDIGPCLLVNKIFYDSIKIEKDQDMVAKNNDLYSLGKIPYSPIAIMSISKRYGNVDVMRYLFKKGYDGNREIFNPFWMAGYIGDEDIFNKLCLSYVLNGNAHIYEFICGLCDGAHVDLFEKYRDNIESAIWFGLMVSVTYMVNNPDMVKKIDETIEYYFEKCRWNNLEGSKMFGYFARDNIEFDYVKNIVESIIGNDKYTLDCLCNGLVLRNRYNIFKWVIKHNKIKNYKFSWAKDKVLHRLIIHNNYQFFFDIFMNHYDKYGGGDIDNLDPSLIYNATKLACYCIEFRRCDIFLLLLKHYHFHKEGKETFMERAKELKFDDIIKVIEDNGDLFM